LGFRFFVHDLEYVAAAALPNFFLGTSFGGLTPGSRVNLVPPWPDLVIAAGRRTAPVARKIKKDSGDRTVLVQLMYPGPSGAEEIDLIVVPRHDGLASAPNVMEVTGAPHRINDSTLQEAAALWQERLGMLPKPRIALIVGGSTRRRTFTEEMACELGQRASAIASKAGGSLMVTTSRRSGEAADTLVDGITVPSFVFRWGDEGENPYFGYLALADAIIVTGDSASMVSEACASSAPVFIYAPSSLITRKHARLHQELYDLGRARPLTDEIEYRRHPPLIVAEAVAVEIRRRFGL
jgi:mitochondrial fission protein ELM1